MNSAHVHLLLNHIPTVGLGVALGLCFLGLIRKSEALKQASIETLFVVALLALPAYLSGYPAKMHIDQLPDVSAAAIQMHLDAALFAFMFLEVTGAAAWLVLWQARRRAQPSAWHVPAVFLLGLITFALMARAASIGGDIRHPEIMTAQERQAEADAPGAASILQTGRLAASLVIDHPWTWPICETIHFFGLSFLMGVLLIVDLRLLGFGKQIPASSLHVLLPWAGMGYTVNVITGVLWVAAAPEQYMGNPAFYFKIIFVVFAGLNVLFLTVYDRAWTLAPGEDSPGTVKLIAASSLFLWFGVLAWGRLMPFLGLTF